MTGLEPAAEVPDVVIGKCALRTFMVSADGHLTPVSCPSDAWVGGVCIGRCNRADAAEQSRGRRAVRPHAVPDEGCSCGVYSFNDLAVLRHQYFPASGLVAVIALEGAVLVGARGNRAEAARVLALWVDPRSLSADAMDKLRANHPDIPFYDDVHTMIDDYPDVTDTHHTGAPAEPATRAARIADRALAAANAIADGLIGVWRLLLQFLFPLVVGGISIVWTALAKSGTPIPGGDENTRVLIPPLPVGGAHNPHWSGSGALYWGSSGFVYLCRRVVAAAPPTAFLSVLAVLCVAAVMLWAGSAAVSGFEERTPLRSLLINILWSRWVRGASRLYLAAGLVAVWSPDPIGQRSLLQIILALCAGGVVGSRISVRFRHRRAVKALLPDPNPERRPAVRVELPGFVAVPARTAAT